jgi:uncharacterized membrane protein (UPF0136 family)
MNNVAIAFYVLFGVFACVGGFIGFKKAGSKASLIAGSISGLFVLTAALLLATGSLDWGYRLGGLVSLLLLSRFLPAFIKTKKWMPQGMMTVMSLLGVLLTLLTYLL